MGDNSRSPSFTPSQTESSLVDPHRAPMQPEVLGIFINTCHMLVPRCAARLHMEICPKKSPKKERQRGKKERGKRKWQRKTSEKCFTLIFCEWRKESVESRTLTWGTAWLNLSRRFSRLLTSTRTRIHTHAHAYTHAHTHTDTHKSVTLTSKQNGPQSSALEFDELRRAAFNACSRARDRCRMEAAGGRIRKGNGLAEAARTSLDCGGN